MDLQHFSESLRILALLLGLSVLTVAGSLAILWLLALVYERRFGVPECSPGNCFCKDTCAFFYVDDVQVDKAHDPIPATSRWNNGGRTRESGQVVGVGS